MLKAPKSAWQSTLLAITKGGVSNVGKTTKHKEAAAFQDKMKPLPARKLCSERKMLSMTTRSIKWTDNLLLVEQKLHAAMEAIKNLGIAIRQRVPSKIQLIFPLCRPRSANL